MSLSNLTEAPVREYIDHGDDRPSLAVLLAAANALKPFTRPIKRLTLADVHIDLAMAGATGDDQGIEAARNTLESIIGDVDSARVSGRKGISTRAAVHAISAALRLGELPHWQQATEGKTIESAYAPFLARTWQAYGFSELGCGLSKPGQGTKLTSQLVEAIPVLLGMRAEHLYGTGWLSRLSLVREDRSVQMEEGINPNWDVGIAPSRTPESFDQPPTKLQIKTNMSTAAGPYNRAGITVVSAKSHGFKGVHRVIKSCVKEHDPDSVKRTSGSARFLTPGELDDITERIATKAGLQGDES